MTVSKQIASEILNQLGGNKFIAMTGSKNFLALENGVTMKLTRNSAGAQYLKITLNALDLYDMEFLKFRDVKGKDIVKTVVKAYNNVYGDMLVELFTETTGLYTKLF